MQITLETQTIELLQRATVMLNVGSYDEIIMKSVSNTLEHASQEKQQNGLPTSQNLIERFRRFRGTLQGVTVDEVASMRHEGLR